LNIKVYDKDMSVVKEMDAQESINAQTWYTDLYLQKIGLSVIWFNIYGCVMGAQIFPYRELDANSIVSTIIAVGAKKVIFNYGGCGETNKYELYSNLQKGLQNKVKIVRFYIVENGMIDKVN